ncbi:hypothetical protein [Algibacter sp. 2305UL17-15]|uniref:hypothetical protein n=1 Tax=Algibacter sp. 2305UL17-15 TaxID=3231268 RepID=UPI00345AF47B
MRIKKYISAIVILLALLGIVHQQQSTLPNQEIVLQFKNVDVTSDDAQNAIILVEKELQSIGVHNFQVKENQNGRLKITYYSDADVDAIKRILSKRIRAELGNSDDEEEPSDFPFEEHTITYNLDVNEIHNGQDTDSGLEGITLQEFKPEAARFYNPKIVSSALQIHSYKATTISRVAFKVNKTIALAINDPLRNIPESRAGPVC